jgi:hypothetical protein
MGSAKWLRQFAHLAFPRCFFGEYQFEHFVPIVGSRAGHLLVGRVGKDDRLLAFLAQPIDVGRRILDIQVGADGGLLLHEAQVPVGNIVLVEPLDGLANRDLMKILDEQPMSNELAERAGWAGASGTARAA